MLVSYFFLFSSANGSIVIADAEAEAEVLGHNYMTEEAVAETAAAAVTDTVIRKQRQAFSSRRYFPTDC